MFGPLGFPEMIFIVVLALLIFGPKRLPEVGRTIGKGMAQFRKATSDLDGQKCPGEQACTHLSANHRDEGAIAL